MKDSCWRESLLEYVGLMAPGVKRHLHAREVGHLYSVFLNT